MTSVSDVAAEPVAARDQLRAQLDVVEDLAVEGDPDRAVVIRHRLRAAGEIDDREPRMGESGSRRTSTPAPSGPRWRTSPIIAREGSSAAAPESRFPKYPAMPHTNAAPSAETEINHVGHSRRRCADEAIGKKMVSG